MDVKIKAKDTRKFYNDIIKELMPECSKITIGVVDRPHFDRPEVLAEHSKGIKGISSISTAQIAKAHEFGVGVPRRSFIRDTMKKWLRLDAGTMANRDYKRVANYLKALSQRLYDRIQEAFDTNGWGKWKSLSDKYKELTGRTDSDILTDTGQLRGAVYVEYAGETASGKKISGIGAKPKRADYGVKRNPTMKEYASAFWKSRRKF